MSTTPARTFHVWWSCMLAVQPNFVHAILSLKCLCKGDSPVALLHIMLGEQSWSCSLVPAWCKRTTDHASVREKTITASKLVGIYWFIWMTCLVYFVSCLCYLSFLSEEAIFLACSYKNSAVSCKAGWTLWRKRPCGTLIWFSSPWMLQWLHTQGPQHLIAEVMVEWTTNGDRLDRWQEDRQIWPL